MDAVGALERGRDAYEKRAWAEAYEGLTRADGSAPLGVADLERLATAAYLTGRDEAFVEVMERAHRAYLEGDRGVQAARCAFWAGLTLLFRGEMGTATGWLARAERLVEGRECVEQGYLRLPECEKRLRRDENDTAYQAAAEAVSIGNRFDDPDLLACAYHLQGRARLQAGRVTEGLALLDEAMIGAVAGELSPIVTGLVYCSVIEACHRAHALGRAREWTSALAHWCDQQPQMEAFSGTCLVLRAEILELQGAWPAAMREAERACERDRPPASAFYRRGELHRLRGSFAKAEAAYRSASERGRDPQPGLALLRLAQGRTEAAEAAIRRVVGVTQNPLERARLLPAYVEILLAVGDPEGAEVASQELEETARRFDTEVLRGLAAHTRGAVELANGDAPAAMDSLRRAWDLWRQHELTYPAARARLLMGLACREMGDGEGARLELEAARRIFVELGATPDVGKVDALLPPDESTEAHGLTPRELEVLRLVATGKTNKAIANELFLSEKTIDRHVSNILSKLRVPSRVAATAYAYEHGLI